MAFKGKLRKGWSRLRFYLSFLLLAFYISLGCMLIFTDEWSTMLPKARIWVGIILILFGCLRFYIAYRRYVNRIIRMKMKKEPEITTDKEEQSNDSINV
jgi:TRAP-type C4-dicarboxylate transport system permease small subunit